MGKILHLSKAEEIYYKLSWKQQEYIKGYAMGRLQLRDFKTIYGYLNPEEREQIQAFIIQTYSQDNGR